MQMIYLKSKSLLEATYQPSFNLTDRRIYDFALYVVQNQSTSFTKKEYEELYRNVNTQTLKKLVERLKDIMFTIERINGLESAYIFEEITYNRGKIDFKFSKEMEPHILIVR